MAITAITAYATSTEADDYHAQFESNGDWSGYTAGEKTFALNEATRWMDAKFARRWKGAKTNDYPTQLEDWPRTGVFDLDGVEFADTTVPQVVKEACCQAALEHRREVTAGRTGLTPTEEASTKRERIGPMEVEYIGGSFEEKLYSLVERLLVDVLEPSAALGVA